MTKTVQNLPKNLQALPRIKPNTCLKISKFHMKTTSFSVNLLLKCRWCQPQTWNGLTVTGASDTSMSNMVSSMASLLASIRILKLIQVLILVELLKALKPAHQPAKDSWVNLKLHNQTIWAYISRLIATFWVFQTGILSLIPPNSPLIRTLENQSTYQRPKMPAQKLMYI